MIDGQLLVAGGSAAVLALVVIALEEHPARERYQAARHTIEFRKRNHAGKLNPQRDSMNEARLMLATAIVRLGTLTQPALPSKDIEILRINDSSVIAADKGETATKRRCRDRHPGSIQYKDLLHNALILAVRATISGHQLAAREVYSDHWHASIEDPVNIP